MSSSHVDRPGDEPDGAGSAPRPFALRSRIWTAALVAGVAAGLLAWLIGEPLHAKFAPPKFVNTASSTGGFLSPAEVYRLDMAKQMRQILDACLVFGTLGMLLGSALGLAGGGDGRTDRPAAWKRALLGLLLGGIVSAGVTALALPIYYRVHNPDTNDLVAGLLLQAAIAAAVGATGGAAFGVGFGHRDVITCAALGGLLGACAGALFYEVLGALAFPLDEVSSPISATWITRLIGRLAVATLASAGAALGVLDRRADASSTAEALASSA